MIKIKVLPAIVNENENENDNDNGNINRKYLIS